MALQDLTPQLRTRLSRMERAVGWFVILATGLLLFGFGYYFFKRAETKGWFKTKIYYQTCVSTSEGLKEGDPVKLMGTDAGEIVSVVPNEPGAWYNITVTFRIKEPNYGYLWSDSKVKVVAKDLLGGRYLEVTKGKDGAPTVHESTNKVVDGILRWKYVQQLEQEMSKQNPNMAEVQQALKAAAAKNPAAFYTNLSGAEAVCWLDPLESPAVTERLERLVSAAEAALPGILDLTNKLGNVLSNTATLTANLSDIADRAKPMVDNLSLLTARLDQPGALGDWLLPTNISYRLDSVLGNADTTVMTANTNLETLNLSLINLGNLTSNLNNQVQVNSNILSQVSTAVVDTDELVQGLKKHWLLRSAFKKPKTNAPPATAKPPAAKPR